MKDEKYHFIGIGGIGMSGLARMALEEGATVTGSDIKSNPIVELLQQKGANISIGHRAENVTSEATVVYSTAVATTNPEYQEALSRRCSLLHRSDLLNILMQGYKALAVAGTHGKTTTSSLLTHLMVEADLDPSYAVGGVIAGLGANSSWGKGEHFVVEADESDGSFTKYSPYGAIVTSVEKEHLEAYGTEERLHDAFRHFIEKTENSDMLLYCSDDPGVRSLGITSGVSYGFEAGADVQALNYRQEGLTSNFDVAYGGYTYHNIFFPMPGKHNVLNALAVFGMALRLGVSEAVIRKAFASFRGVARRVEKVYDDKGVIILDDYAHHPTEVSATLQGIRQAIGERRLVAVFQPHRYSRVKLCYDEFMRSFGEADIVIVTDVYAAGERNIDGITSQKICDDIAKKSRAETYYHSREDLVEAMIEYIRPHDLVVTLGAGDITKVGRDVGSYFSKEGPHKIHVGVMYGGRSCEHDISLLSAQYIRESLDRSLYHVHDIFVTKDGGIGASQGCTPEALYDIQRCDILIPVFHGPYGEDGMMQGFLDILGKAYVGCDHKAAAVAMDKAMTKHLAIHAGVMTAPFVEVSRRQWQRDPKAVERDIMEKVSCPLFVKPVHLGSSIGITYLEDTKGLEGALSKAFECDDRVIIEEKVYGREVEFAVLGNEVTRVAGPGEICVQGGFYDYESKYDKPIETDITPKLPSAWIEHGREQVQKVYSAIGCTGLSRVDGFLDEQGTFVLNEVNPFPGFTAISLYPQLWNAEGVTGSQLVDNLIVLGLARHRLQMK
jgi:UDP-N-acetylmuramate--alanine ligase